MALSAVFGLPKHSFSALLTPCVRSHLLQKFDSWLTRGWPFAPPPPGVQRAPTPFLARLCSITVT